MRRVIASFAVGAALLGLVTAVAPTAEAAATAGASYTPLSSPVRAASVSVAARHTVTATLSTVPSGASAAAVELTAAGGSAAGAFTVYTTGTSRPATSNVDFAAKQTITNAAVVRVGGTRSVTLYNSSTKAAHVSLDVTGYWTPAAAGQGSFGAISPVRQLNTGAGVGAKGPLAAHHALSFTATGGSTGIPSSASSVLVNLTAVKPTKAGYLTAYPAAGSRPSDSTMNFDAHATLAHLAVVPINSAGRVSVYNGSAGSLQVLGDVVGWFAGGDPTAAGAFGVLAPYRLLSAKSVAAHTSVSVSSAGRGGVPKSGVRSLALNVRVASAAAGGELTVNPGSSVSTRDLSFVKGQSVANLVLARASGGSVRIYNGSSARITVSADVTGYVLAADADVPAVSTSRYVRNITGVSSDVSTMSNEGQADCAGGSKLVLLDIGAQSNTTPTTSSNGVVLSKANPGVRLSATDIRLPYAKLVTALQGYLDGFGACFATIAVSTSNDGDWSAYPAAAKASDWARKVIAPLQQYAANQGRTGETIVGASDIESSFGSTAAQARAWVKDYLADAGSGSTFIENGSLDNCATAYGSAAECGAVAHQTGPTWTRADYAQLTRGIAPGRIQALPQIYHAAQAVQWANLDRYSGALTFAGALTEHAAACGSECAYTPGEGWAALHHALSTVSATVSIPQLTDLRSDDSGAGARAVRRPDGTPGNGA